MNRFERNEEDALTSSRPVRFNIDEKKEEGTAFEILLRDANEKLFEAKTMPRRRFEGQEKTSKCFRVGVDEDTVTNLAKCQELIQNVFPAMDRNRELVAVQIPFPLADSISMKDNVVVYSSPETKTNGVREGDLLLMLEGTIVVDRSDADVLRLAESIMREEEEGDQQYDDGKKSFNVVFLH